MNSRQPIRTEPHEPDSRTPFAPLDTWNDPLPSCMDQATPRAGHALQARLRLAANMFANVAEGIVVTAVDGSIVDVNPAFEAITGYARADVVGRNPRLLGSGRQDKAFYMRMWRALEQDGYWQGEVWNRRKSGETYVEQLTISAVRDDAGKPLNYVGIFTDVTLQKQQAQHLEQIVHYDPLTRLPNRRLLADRLQQALARARRNGTRVAVACIDLDGFKAVNDAHGHECGDGLLVAVGRRMKQAVRDFDTVCRLGGDEFVAVIGDVRVPDDFMPMIARLLDSVAQPAVVDGKVLRITASLGVAIYPQDEEIDADQLVRQADQAMYMAKDQGRNRWCLFDSAQHRSTLERNGQVDEIARALERREFVLYYQPIVDLASGTLNSVEALIRWQHPQRGLLVPGEFLPAIEDHPLMIPLGNWVLGEALDQHERWLDAGRDIAISVNMSSAQLQQDGFVADLQAALATRPRLAPGRLKLEVLETSALEDIDRVSQTMAACAAFGVGFSLDDFGTGYSSLLYLKRLPARRIKIDQRFVRNMLGDPDDLAILQGVIGMAAAFKREVVAEGVETLDHARMLVQLGCPLVQGYGIARPMPADRVIEWAAGWTLPPALAGAALLGRADTLLLGAIVECRAWTSSLLEQARPDSDCSDVRLQEWLEDAGAGQDDELRRLRKALHGAARALRRTPGRAVAVQRFRRIGDVLLGRLSGLLERR